MELNKIHNMDCMEGMGKFPDKYFVGSGSSIIACEYMGFDYCGFEIDEEYWAGANARLEKEREKMRQIFLFGEETV